MSWYCKAHNKRELKHYKDILEMTKEYNEHFQYNYSDDDLEELNNSKDDIKDLSSISSSILTSNYYSSSVEEEKSKKKKNPMKKIIYYLLIIIMIMIKIQEEKITKEMRKGSARVSSLKFSEGSYRPKGYRGFFDVDGGFGVGHSGDGYIGFTTSHGFQTCPYFFIGAGLGVEYHVGWSTVFLPIFGNMHINFLNKRCSPFLDLKGGYSPIDGKGGYMSAAFGVNYQFTPKVGINFSFGYF